MEEKIVVKKPPKSPFLAGLLSFFFPGTGALYNGDYLRGVIYIIIFAGLITIQKQGQAQPFVALMLAGFYIFQIIDSVNTAGAINRKAVLGEKTQKIEEDQISRVVKSGSVFWGAVLMGLGIILLLGNFEVIDYDHIFDFWPLVIIVIGLKFIADYFAKKNGTSQGGNHGQ